jgi:hypothetical protein
MKKMWIPLTYAPKIEGVKTGKIRQTIRLGGKTLWAPGDMIGFHGWSGRPYHSAWSFRFGPFPLKHAHHIVVYPDGIDFLLTLHPDIRPWSALDSLALQDGIDPPTGEILRQVMNRYHKIPKEGLAGQILRW